MFLKYAADPNQQLAAIDFWTMGSLASITREKIMFIDMKILLWWGFYVIFRPIGTNSSSYCKPVQISSGFFLRLGPFYSFLPAETALLRRLHPAPKHTRPPACLLYTSRCV